MLSYCIAPTTPVGRLIRGIASGQGRTATQGDVAVLTVDARARVERDATVVGGVAIAVGPQGDVATIAAECHVAYQDAEAHQHFQTQTEVVWLDQEKPDQLGVETLGSAASSTATLINKHN